MAVNYPAHDPALPVVAVDFDGVLAKNTWPSPGLGRANFDALSMVIHYYDSDCEVVVFTARPDSHLERIWSWLDDNGIGDYVYDVTNKKPKACLYFDDRAVRWPLCG